MDDALDDDYAKAGFGGRLAIGERPALLIVDVCMAYLDPGSPLYAGVESALASNIRLVAAARASGVPVIFHARRLRAGRRRRRAVLPQGTRAEGVPAGLAARRLPSRADAVAGDVVVTKQYASAFFGSSLASTLNAMRVDTVFVTGFSTSGCVRATALDALQSGFVPFVVADACGDRDPRPHGANLFDLQAKYAEVVSEKIAIGLLSGRA